MSTSRIPSGFGRMYAVITVLVNCPYDRLFIDAGWKTISRSDSSAVFEYTCSNRYAGDDESIVQAIWSDLPHGIDTDCFAIDWQNSVY